MIENIVVNTIVFEDLIQAGAKQWEVFERVKSLGISKIEIRREWITDFQEEIPKMVLEAEKYKMELLYSIPATLFIEKRLAVDKLLEYLDEAQRMGIKMIKFTIGDFEAVNIEEVLRLKGILQNKQMVVTVENDQTMESGKVEGLTSFLDCCKEYDVPVYCTYDVGNWCWVNEDAVDNAPQLAEYVKYIHLKDVSYENDKPIAQCLDNGQVDWRAVLKILPPNIPVGIEYPCGAEPLAMLQDAIEKLVAAH